MFYNYSFMGPFVLFAIALMSLFNGATALKTHVWSGFGRELQGRSADRAGWIFVAIGVASLGMIGIIVI